MLLLWVARVRAQVSRRIDSYQVFKIHYAYAIEISKLRLIFFSFFFSIGTSAYQNVFRAAQVVFSD